MVLPKLTSSSTPLRRRAACLTKRDVLVLAVLAALAVTAIVLFLTIGVRGNIGYIMARRSAAVMSLVLVAIGIAVSTVVFQTLTANRILTPSIMGFDSLYVLIQTVAVQIFGAVGLAGLGAVPRFLIEVGLLLLLAVILYGRLLSGRADVTKLLLIGVVVGMLFRGLSNFVQRVMSPDVFLVLQDRMFASFSRVQADLLPWAATLVCTGLLLVLVDRRRLDVLALGPDLARGLGVDPDRLRVRLLAAVALMVAVSTALVGPVTFFGLLVAHLAYQLLSTQRHSIVLPAASLAAVVALVGGQLIIEHVLPFEASLSIIIELVGGLVFLALILRRSST